jgi:hypothetical protein
MGDESYFSAKYPKGESIGSYYSKIDSGVTTGLEEVESMLVGQLKELNQLTRGNAYSQKITIAGLKKDFELIIFLATLIYMGTMKSLWTLPKKNYGWKQL